MAAPQELKDQLLGTFHTGVDGVVNGVVDSAYDAGVASVPAGGGFTQEQLDAAVVAAVAAERVRIQTGLQTIDATEDSAVAALINP